MDNRDDIRDLLATRRAKLTPADVGLPTSARRRVPGLRREEVAVLAGVSTEWYTKLEKGHIAGVSEEVLAAVAEALRLDDDERTYLLGLARTAKPARRQPTRRREVPVPAQVQWMLDSITFSAAFIRNGRLDVIGVNALGRALHAPMFDSPTARGGGRTSRATTSWTPVLGSSSSTGRAVPPRRSPWCGPRRGVRRTTWRCGS